MLYKFFFKVILPVISVACPSSTIKLAFPFSYSITCDKINNLLISLIALTKLFLLVVSKLVKVPIFSFVVVKLLL